MKIIILIFILFSMFESVKAQEVRIPEPSDSNHIFLMIGFECGAGLINHNEFNKFTDIYGWNDNFSNFFGYFNGEIGLFLRNTYLSIDFNVPFDGYKSNNSTISFVLARYMISMKMGYEINLNRDFLLIPNFSYGYSNNKLTYKKKYDFGEQIDYRNTLNKNQFALDINGSAPFFVTALDFSIRLKRAILSLSFKYCFSEYSNWNLMTTKVYGIPDYDFSGFYTGINLRVFALDITKLIREINN